jgi:hypothetical protein
MMIKIKYIAILSAMIITIVTIYGCISEIEYSADDPPNSINISGLITNELEDQEVEIKKVVSLEQGATVVGDPISDATVTIIDSKNNKYALPYTSKGIYTTKLKFVVGEKYKLVVNHQNKVYESKFEELQKPVPIDSINLTYFEESAVAQNGTVVKNKKLGVNLFTKLHDGNKPVYTYYRVGGQFEFKEDEIRIAPFLRTCFISTQFDFGNLLALNGADYPNNVIKDKRLLATNYDYRFAFNFGFRIDQFVVNESTYRYWNNLSQIVKPDRSIFDPPPGFVKSNIICTTNPSEEVYGSFTVASKSSVWKFTNSNRLKVPMTPYCNQFGFNFRPLECRDCRTIPGSTTDKPSYWPY